MNVFFMEINQGVRKRILEVLMSFFVSFAGSRILYFLSDGNVIYTLGITGVLLFAGSWILFKKAFFIEDVCFSVKLRILLAIPFSVFQILGLYYSNFEMKEKPCKAEIFVWMICFIPVVYAVQNLFLHRLLKNQIVPNKEIQNINLKKKFWIAFSIIMAGFMIPFATYYPTIMAYDAIPQLTQIITDAYTTHHPLIHTLMLALCLQIGRILPFVHNADSAGLAIYSVFQMIIVAGGFAYTYIFLRKYKVHKIICNLFLIAVAFYPTCGMLAVSITKDTIYATLVLVFSLCLCEMILSKGNCLVSRKWCIGYGMITAFLLLFRNNSIYAWIIFFLVASVYFYKKEYSRRIFGIHVVSFIVYLVMNGIMVFASSATSDTYAREMLSVPSQQIARVVYYHESELDETDRELLMAVWGKDNYPEYYPAIADRSKRDITNDAESLRAFKDIWVRLGLRYPGEYIEAFLLKNKGIWYLSDTSYLDDIYTYAKGYLQITYPSDQQEYVDELIPGYTRHQHLQILQKIYRYFAGGDAVWKYFPIIGTLMQPAFYCWALFYYIIACIVLRRKELLIPAIYLVVLLATIALGPCILVRYVYPIMLTVPILFLTLLYTDKD